VQLASLKIKLVSLRKQGYKIAFTNGCFDILHIGHVSYLQKAKRKDRILIVGLNSDRSIKSIKGNSRPIVDQRGRAGVLAALTCVDFVVLFHADTPLNLIKSIKPDILIKGADWKGKDVAGGDFVEGHGGKVEFIQYIPGVSSTDIIERILQSA